MSKPQNLSVAYFQARLKLLSNPSWVRESDVSAAFSPRKPGFSKLMPNALHHYANTLPIPLQFLLAACSQYKRAAYKAIGEIESEMNENFSAALAHTTMLPEDIHDLAGRLKNVFKQEFEDEENLPNLLFKIAETKQKLINDNNNDKTAYDAAQHLPKIAFPLVIKAGRFPSIVWETIFTGLEAKALLAKAKAPKIDSELSKAISTAAKAISNRFGSELDTQIICPAIHLFGLKAAGASGGLAVWTALWLSAAKCQLPAQVLAFTGILAADGSVKAVQDIEIKVKSALSCGFSYIIIPSENLKELSSSLKKDQRIIGIKNCDQLREWLLLKDPEFAARGKLFHFARGIITTNSLPSAKQLKQSFYDEIKAAKLADTLRNLKRVAENSSRPSRYKRYSQVIERCRLTLSELISQNDAAQNSSELVLGIFKLLVPESFFLLHVPLLLKQFLTDEQALADRLYAQFGHRLADHDLNLDLALELSKPILDDIELNPWNDQEFRKRYPLLCWFFFNDPFKALNAIASWKDPLPMEVEWGKRILKKLACCDPAEIADPTAPHKVRRRMQKILEYAICGASADNEPSHFNEVEDFYDALREFKPFLTHETPIDLRPALILRILLTAKSLDEEQKNTLYKHFFAHINAKTQNSEELTLAKELIDCTKLNEKRLKMLITRCNNSKLQMLRRCKDSIAEYARSLKNSDDKNVKRVKSVSFILDSTADLQKAISLFIGEPTFENSNYLNFHTFLNPALQLCKLSLEYTKKNVNKSEIERLSNKIYGLISNNSIRMLGFRSNLARECLMHWLGGLTALGFLPKVPASLNKSLGLSFLIGFKFAQNTAAFNPDKQLNSDKISLDHKILDGIVNAILHCDSSLICLKQIYSFIENSQRRVIAETLLSKDLQQNIMKAGAVGLSMFTALWPPDLTNELPKEIRDELGDIENNFFRNPRTFKQKEKSLLLINALMGLPSKKYTLNYIIKAAKSISVDRGFSPVALAYVSLISPQSELHMADVVRILKTSCLWQVEWERSLFLSMLLFCCHLRNNKKGVLRLIAQNSCDLPNAFLGNMLLKA